MMRRFVLTLVVVAALAVPAGAAEPFIALVDLDRGLLLIPEGTAVPRGVEFYLEPDHATMRHAGERNGDGVSGRTPADEREAAVPDTVVMGEAAASRPLVYAYAPADQFVTARKTIEERQRHQVATLVDDMDQFYYFYFYDGSYHGARKRIHNTPEFPLYSRVSYAVQTEAYTAGGSYDTKISISQSSSQYSYWTVANTCWFYGTDGTCSTPTYGFNSSPTFTATITSHASLVRYLYPPCDLPCKENLSSAIVISFP